MSEDNTEVFDNTAVPYGTTHCPNCGSDKLWHGAQQALRCFICRWWGWQR